MITKWSADEFYPWFSQLPQDYDGPGVEVLLELSKKEIDEFNAACEIVIVMQNRLKEKYDRT